MRHFADMHDTARVDGLFVADFFEKRHDHVLRDIVKITAPKYGLSEEFIRSNFAADCYKDSVLKGICFLCTITF